MKRPSYSSKRKGFRFPFHLFIFQIVFIAIFSCSEEEEGPDCSPQGTNFSISDISGNWTATSATFFTLSDPIETVDVVAEGGSVTLAIQSNGGFTLTITESGGPSDSSSGDFCFDEDLLVVRFDGDAADDWEYFRAQLTSGNNNLSIGGPAEFDFDGDGSPDPAEVELSLIRS